MAERPLLGVVVRRVHDTWMHMVSSKESTYANPLARSTSQCDDDRNPSARSSRTSTILIRGAARGRVSFIALPSNAADGDDGGKTYANERKGAILAGKNSSRASDLRESCARLKEMVEQKLKRSSLDTMTQAEQPRCPMLKFRGRIEPRNLYRS